MDVFFDQFVAIGEDLPAEDEAHQHDQHEYAQAESATIPYHAHLISLTLVGAILSLNLFLGTRL